MTIKTDNGTLRSALKLAKDRAEQDYSTLQRQGRALTEVELRQSAALAKCLEFIEEALGILKEKN